MRVLVYSKPSCPFCKRAKDLLNLVSIPFEEVDLSNATRAVLDEFAERTKSARTVPQVVVLDGERVECLGGYSDIAAPGVLEDLLNMVRT